MLLCWHSRASVRVFALSPSPVKRNCLHVIVRWILVSLRVLGKAYYKNSAPQIEALHLLSPPSRFLHFSFWKKKKKSTKAELTLFQDRFMLHFHQKDCLVLHIYFITLVSSDVLLLKTTQSLIKWARKYFQRTRGRDHRPFIHHFTSAPILWNIQ